MRYLSIPKAKLFEPFLWVYFVWYYLPVARAFFRSGIYNQLFFGLFAIGCALCFYEYITAHQEIRFQYNPLIPVLAYLLVFFIFSLLNIATAKDHIRVSFTFWGSLIVYYLTVMNPRTQKRLVVLGMVMLLTTAITSMVGVVVNPRAARIITYASNDIEEDLAIRLLNIGGLAFFQGLVVCVPILLTLISHNKYKRLAIVALSIIFISLLSASFTIALIVFVVAVIMGYIANNSLNGRVMAISICLIIIFVVPWSNVLMWLSEIINNPTISERLLSLASSLSSGSAEGDLSSRVNLYLSSLNTFLEQPWGVGPEYTFVNYEKGIGYHSQFLDDLARYGVFALIFYIAFFAGYYKLLYKQWSKIDLQQIALPVVIVYFIFLVLNPGFTSPHEGVLLLFLIPAFPDVINKNEETQPELIVS